MLIKTILYKAASHGQEPEVSQDNNPTNRKVVNKSLSNRPGNVSSTCASGGEHALNGINETHRKAVHHISRSNMQSAQCVVVLWTSVLDDVVVLVMWRGVGPGPLSTKPSLRRCVLLYMHMYDLCIFRSMHACTDGV